MSSLRATRLLSRRPALQCLSTIRQPALKRPTTFVQSHRSITTSAPRRASLHDAVSPPRNPLDKDAVNKYQKSRKQAVVRKQVYLGLAASITMLIPLFLAYLYPMDDDNQAADKAGMKIVTGDRMDAKDDATFQGKPVVVTPGAQKLVAQDPDSKQEIELVETGTSYVPHFPKTISLPNEAAAGKEEEYTLVGLGIRKVSFLSIQVYVVGFYVKNAALEALQSALIHQINPNASALILDEKKRLEESLVDPEESLKIWDSILQDKSAGLDTIFRVVPVRDTNFNHLRDGWVTGITNKIQDATQRRQKLLKEAEQNGSVAAVPPPEFEDESMGLAMRNFKSLWSAKGKAPKGSVILLERTPDGALEAYFQKNPAKGGLEKVGRVDDERVSRLIWLLYLGGKNVSSEETRRDVVKGIMQMAERPAGTVEFKVS